MKIAIPLHEGKFCDHFGGAEASGMTLHELEVLHITDALRRNSGNRKDAAGELGIHPSTLFRKIRDLGIETPETDGRKRRE